MPCWRDDKIYSMHELRFQIVQSQFISNVAICIKTCHAESRHLGPSFIYTLNNEGTDIDSNCLPRLGTLNPEILPLNFLTHWNLPVKWQTGFKMLVLEKILGADAVSIESTSYIRRTSAMWTTKTRQWQSCAQNSPPEADLLVSQPAHE